MTVTSQFFTDCDILTLLQFTVKAGDGDFLKRCDGLNSPGGEECNLKLYVHDLPIYQVTLIMKWKTACCRTRQICPRQWWNMSQLNRDVVLNSPEDSRFSCSSFDNAKSTRDDYPLVLIEHACLFSSVINTDRPESTRFHLCILE